MTLGADLNEVESIAETSAALLVRVTDHSIRAGLEYWVPKSALDRESHVKRKGQRGVLIVAPWFAQKISRTVFPEQKSGPRTTAALAAKQKVQACAAKKVRSK